MFLSVFDLFLKFLQLHEVHQPSELFVVSHETCEDFPFRLCFGLFIEDVIIFTVAEVWHTAEVQDLTLDVLQVFKGTT